jgi:hypothetical protein
MKKSPQEIFEERRASRRGCRRPLALRSKGSSMADELAVYDGRKMIGTTRRNGPHAFVARTLEGKKLGTFPDQAAATHAVRASAR